MKIANGQRFRRDWIDEEEALPKKNKTEKTSVENSHSCSSSLEDSRDGESSIHGDSVIISESDTSSSSETAVVRPEEIKTSVINRMDRRLDKFASAIAAFTAKVDACIVECKELQEIKSDKRYVDRAKGTITFAEEKLALLSRSICALKSSLN
jgi:hypothetical protein